MDVIPKLVKTYVSALGNDYFSDWFANLNDNRTRSIIYSRIGRVARGNLGNSKYLGDGVFEIKIDHGPGFRVYYGVEENYLMVLLLGGDKSTQERDILKARQLWAEDRRSHEKDK